MYTFLTLFTFVKGYRCTWQFSINEVDGKKYFFCRNKLGRTHAFADAKEQTAKIAQFIQMGYKPCESCAL